MQNDNVKFINFEFDLVFMPTQTTQQKRTRCAIWTRVMGYHRPVSHFNIGKKAEHHSRKHFQECVAANSEFMARYA